MQTTFTAKRALSYFEPAEESIHTATTGFRAPADCWAPQRPMTQMAPEQPNVYSATTGTVAPGFCRAPQRPVTQEVSDISSDEDDDAPSTYFKVTTAFASRSCISDISSDEDEPPAAGYTATTGFRAPAMCWAPKRVRH